MDRTEIINASPLSEFGDWWAVWTELIHWGLAWCLCVCSYIHQKHLSGEAGDLNELNDPGYSWVSGILFPHRCGKMKLEMCFGILHNDLCIEPTACGLQDECQNQLGYMLINMVTFFLMAGWHNFLSVFICKYKLCMIALLVHKNVSFPSVTRHKFDFVMFYITSV